MKKKNKILVVGAFDLSGNAVGGQTVKTREIFNLMCVKYGVDNVRLIDTFKWKCKIIKVFFNFLQLSMISEKIIILPAQRGVQILSQLISIIKRIATVKIYYDVIGAWLPDKLQDDSKLLKSILKYDGIWVETKTMKNRLNQLGLTNVFVINNFKNLKIITEREAPINTNIPLKICTFSRVLKEKGIEDAIEAITYINKKYSSIQFILDIYGKIDSEYEKKFICLSKQFPSFIAYKGVVNAYNSVSILKEYSILLFPTHYRTEGIPGSIIDAYFAGLPIVSAKWQNFSDVIDEGITGFGYTMLDNNEMIKVLEHILANPQILINIQKNCLRKAHEYTPEYVFNQIINTGF